MIFIWFKIQRTAIGRFFFYCRFCWLNAKGRKAFNDYDAFKKQGRFTQQGSEEKTTKELTLKLLLSLKASCIKVHISLKNLRFLLMSKTDPYHLNNISK